MVSIICAPNWDFTILIFNRAYIFRRMQIFTAPYPEIKFQFNRANELLTFIQNTEIDPKHMYTPYTLLLT